MGLRATVIKTYKIEYGNTQGFNYDPYTIASIISEFCDDYYTGEESTDVVWEVDKNQFSNMITEIQKMPEEEFNELMKEVWFSGEVYGSEPYSKRYVLEVFSGWLNETQEDSNYVRFGWL
jgi:hypothetical protein